MSIAAVAQRAGVSPATVSRAFNAPQTVAPATRARIEAAAQFLAYTPNASAQTLRTRRTRSLGVLLPTLLNPVFAEYLSGVADAASSAGYSIVPVATDYVEARESDALVKLIARDVDGLLLTVANAQQSALLARLRRSGLPYVLTYNRHPEHPCVCVDGETAMRQLVSLAHAAGHRRIAMVSGQRNASDRAQQRHQGYLTAMHEFGLAPRLIEVPFMEALPSALTQPLGKADRPTALLCSNDLLAIRSLRAAAMAQLRVPEDVAVIGFDGIALGQELVTTLTTVAQPNRDIGLRGVQWLIDALSRHELPRPAHSITLPHQVRPGESFPLPHPMPSTPFPCHAESPL
ncbi:LacI family DNA-binding transcriptional regulator [Ideonella sp. B508-1]|uniref:LacI family DNA-binding transcriptional regulator n=1 Tax=Ideonella sp. B508-1 TaxID=137716 RepID=UPI00034CB24B|nr:LacI family DNA-binding transcriptional regulator [Ideonella sp. B508-1]